ncbi:MAG: glutaredoxin [Deltaproteobacteria bacterium]|nr:glutaredoxin [Deltaproteobacteria bacterium]
MGAHIIVYRTESCPYCVAAKQLLQKRGYEFEEVYLDRDASRMAELKEQFGWRTVPMIVVGDTFVGGYTDLRQLDTAGTLAQLVGTP